MRLNFKQPERSGLNLKSFYLYFSSNEETGDADELQRRLEDVFLRGHEAIKVVLSEVVRLPVQFVDFTHLQKQSRSDHVRTLTEEPQRTRQGSLPISLI